MSEPKKNTAASEVHTRTWRAVPAPRRVRTSRTAAEPPRQPVITRRRPARSTVGGDQAAGESRAGRDRGVQQGTRASRGGQPSPGRGQSAGSFSGSGSPAAGVRFRNGPGGVGAGMVRVMYSVAA
ncbi:hypothetical protein ACH49_22235 [Streptomyces leeuwenhoekii]|uniref:Uncharacterized protein n=1 Tax=Streptomyces leeuwenhoekii TaxID=1437453 RepID=A0ABR5HUJ7_STRLW|nr:hypothetical protein ACH49_22235 [Streptomyces leeuwenhoekii]